MSFPSLQKPAMWAVTPGLIAPEWQWFWRDAVFVAPLWEGGGSPRDISINQDSQNLIGTLSGNAAWAGTARGIGIDFAAGASDRVDFGTVNMVGPKGAGANAFTVEVLARVDGTSADQGIFANGNLSASSTNWFMFWDKAATVSGRTDTVTFGVVNLSGSGLSRVEGSTNLLTAGEITHLIGQFRQTPETLKLFKNGVLDQEDTALNGVNPSDTLIKTLQIGAADGAIELDGAVLLAVVYWKILNETEILQRARDPFGPFRMVDEARVVYALAGAASMVHRQPHLYQPLIRM